MAVELPSELWRLIEEHSAASTVQTAFRRWRLFKHARRPAWPAVRAHLGAEAVWHLWPYALVRREWRLEPESWLATTDVELLIREARDGLFGGMATVR